MTKVLRLPEPERLPVPDPYFMREAGADLGFPDWESCFRLARTCPKVITDGITHPARLAGSNQYEYGWGGITLRQIFPNAEIIWYVGHKKIPGADYLTKDGGELFFVEVKAALPGISIYGDLEHGYVPAGGLVRVDLDKRAAREDWSERCRQNKHIPNWLKEMMGSRDWRPRYHLLISVSASTPERYDNIRYVPPEMAWLTHMIKADFYNIKLKRVKERPSMSGSGRHAEKVRMELGRFHSAVTEYKIQVDVPPPVPEPDPPEQLSLVRF